MAVGDGFSELLSHVGDVVLVVDLDALEVDLDRGDLGAMSLNPASDDLDRLSDAGASDSDVVATNMKEVVVLLDGLLL